MRWCSAAALLLPLAACAVAEEAEPEIRMISLQHANAAEVAIQLRPLVPEGVSFDLVELPAVNGILIRGSPSECDALAAEIRRLDRPGGD